MRLRVAGEEEGIGELGKGEVELGSSFPAGGDAPVCVQPGSAALNLVVNQVQV